MSGEWKSEIVEEKQATEYTLPGKLPLWVTGAEPNKELWESV